MSVSLSASEDILLRDRDLGLGLGSHSGISWSSNGARSDVCRFGRCASISTSFAATAGTREPADYNEWTDRGDQSITAQRHYRRRHRPATVDRQRAEVLDSHGTYADHHAPPAAQGVGRNRLPRSSPAWQAPRKAVAWPPEIGSFSTRRSAAPSRAAAHAPPVAMPSHRRARNEPLPSHQQSPTAGSTTYPVGVACLALRP
jgi:hypothetical protein